jgi:hypothetical protein
MPFQWNETNVQDDQIVRLAEEGTIPRAAVIGLDMNILSLRKNNAFRNGMEADFYLQFRQMIGIVHQSLLAVRALEPPSAWKSHEMKQD